MGIEDEDRKDSWVEDGESFVAKDAIGCARAVYAHILTAFPTDEEMWMHIADFEREHGTYESLRDHLQQAVSHCPKAEVLWLMGAKSAWLAGNVDAARAILSNAFEANPGSEEIWLAAMKLESENNEYDRARALLTKARENADTARVWMKSVRLEWVLDDLEAAKKLLKRALRRFPDYPKFYMMHGQILEQENDIQKAREIYVNGVKTVPLSVDLWLCAVTLELKESSLSFGRSFSTYSLQITSPVLVLS